jgi:hypothetical protein
MSDIKQIENELDASFNACQTSLERSCWKVYAAKDIVRILGGRAPAPAELAILDRYGLTAYVAIG